MPYSRKVDYFVMVASNLSVCQMLELLNSIRNFPILHNIMDVWALLRMVAQSLSIEVRVNLLE